MNQSSPLSRLVFGVVFILMGSVATFSFSRTMELVCTRDEIVVCTLEKRLLGFYALEQQEIVDLTGAQLGQSSGCRAGRPDDDCTYRVELLTPNDRVPLTSFYSGGRRRHQDRIGELQTFLSNPEATTLTINSTFAEFLLSLVPLLFVFSGFILLVSGFVAFLF